MTREEHLLSILAEECAEVVQRVSKVFRFGLSDVQDGQPWDNRARLLSEVRDVRAAILMLEAAGVLPSDPEDARAVDAKVRRVELYLRLSERLGRLDRPKG